MVADTQRFKTFTFQCNGKDYDLIYRTMNTAGQIRNDGMVCYNRTDKHFINCVFSTSANMSSLLDGGVSAIVNVGKYVFASANTVVSSAPGVDTMAATMFYSVAWVRGGAYARKYTIKTIHQSGAVAIHSYTTPTSAYPGVLDTSDIPATATDYTKQVNDRVNAYNSAVTQWIGTAAAAIVPSAIATQLRTVLQANLGAFGVLSEVRDSTVVIDANFMSDKIIEVTCEDSGDGTLFRGVGNDVTAAELVSTIHTVGKTVRVRPKKNDGSDVYYLVATPKVAGSTSWTDVIWKEGPGYTTNITNLFCMGTVVSDTLYFAGNAAELTVLAGGTHPSPVPNGVGDRVSVPLPTFIGRRIDYLGIFQDRLVVGAGAVLYFSRTGDYQNFWRQSVLTIDPSDPIEMFALGAEDDTIQASTTYDRNLLLFGERKQYVVSGRQPLTPSNASIVIQSAHEDAVDSFPVNSGNFVFYNKFRNGVASMHQVQIGQLVDTPESYEVSKQLDRYIKGMPVEIVAVTSPNNVFVRTQTQRDRVYVYTYLDSPAGAERLFDSWSTWSWRPAVGTMMGISRDMGDILAYYFRYDGVGSIWLACDRFVLDTDVSNYPYVDSLRPMSTYLAGGATDLRKDGSYVPDLSLAFDVSVPEFMLGVPAAQMLDFNIDYPDNAAAKWVGVNYDAFVTPTNPYILDSNGKAIVNGRLTISSAIVSVADSGGLTAKLVTKNGMSVPVDFTGRVLGTSTNVVGRAPIATTAISVPLGRETRDFTYTLSARKWLPLTVTAIEWTGQFFNNTRRV
jgi:hypothetical protein